MMVMIGEGDTAEVIEYCEGKVCKLFYKGYPEEYIKLEYQNAKEMYENRLPVPDTFGMINMEGRNGIIYERIYGRSLWDIFTEKGDDKALRFVCRFTLRNIESSFRKSDIV